MQLTAVVEALMKMCGKGGCAIKKCLFTLDTIANFDYVQEFGPDIHINLVWTH